jgi:hypothetical protein
MRRCEPRSSPLAFARTPVEFNHPIKFCSLILNNRRCDEKDGASMRGGFIGFIESLACNLGCCTGSMGLDPAGARWRFGGSRSRSLGEGLRDGHAEVETKATAGPRIFGYGCREFGEPIKAGMSIREHE